MSSLVFGIVGVHTFIRIYIILVSVAGFLLFSLSFSTTRSGEPGEHLRSAAILNDAKAWARRFVFFIWPKNYHELSCSWSKRKTTIDCHGEFTGSKWMIVDDSAWYLVKLELSWTIMLRLTRASDTCELHMPVNRAQSVPSEPSGSGSDRFRFAFYVWLRGAWEQWLVFLLPVCFCVYNGPPHIHSSLCLCCSWM